MHGTQGAEALRPILMQARINVPDERFKWLCELYKPKSEVPAFLEIVDIAGLVRQALRLHSSLSTLHAYMPPMVGYWPLFGVMECAGIAVLTFARLKKGQHGSILSAWCTLHAGAPRRARAWGTAS